MATQRRIVTSEKTHLDQDEKPQESSIAPAVPSAVIAKLLGFTFAMITVPIGTYFLTLNTIYGGGYSFNGTCDGVLTIRKGNSTYSGATAAFMANVVLIGYVIVAFKEDQSERAEMAEQEKKKSR
ncbi:hypothetical protein MBLNU457_7820t2 [Dothideomycetes sp. NU457]